jgi:hypothetical protein
MRAIKEGVLLLPTTSEVFPARARQHRQGGRRLGEVEEAVAFEFFAEPPDAGFSTIFVPHVDEVTREKYTTCVGVVSLWDLGLQVPDLGGLRCCRAVGQLLLPSRLAVHLVPSPVAAEVIWS